VPSISVWFQYFVGHIFFPNTHELLVLCSVRLSSTTIQTIWKNCYGCVQNLNWYGGNRTWSFNNENFVVLDEI
jgi:hypothetical protein